MYDVFVNPKIYFATFQFWLSYCICHLYCIYYSNNSTHNECHRYILFCYICILFTAFILCTHILWFCVYILYFDNIYFVFFDYILIACAFLHFVHILVSCMILYLVLFLFCIYIFSLYYTICFLLCLFCHPPDQNSWAAIVAFSHHWHLSPGNSEHQWKKNVI